MLRKRSYSCLLHYQTLSPGQLLERFRRSWPGESNSKAILGHQNHDTDVLSPPLWNSSIKCMLLSRHLWGTETSPPHALILINYLKMKNNSCDSANSLIYEVWPSSPIATSLPSYLWAVPCQRRRTVNTRIFLIFYLRILANVTSKIKFLHWKNYFWGWNEIFEISKVSLKT